MITLGLTTRIELRDGVVTVYDHLDRVAATMSGAVATVYLGAIDGDVLLVGATAPGAVTHLPPDHDPDRPVDLDEIDALLALAPEPPRDPDLDEIEAILQGATS